MSRMTVILRWGFLVLSVILSTHLAVAGRAWDKPIVLTQPDGTRLHVLLQGDEFFHYYTTTDDYVIARTDSDYFVYATYDAFNNIIPGTVRVSDGSNRTIKEMNHLLTLTKGLPESVRKNMEQGAIQSRSLMETSASVAAFPTTGSIITLVILVNFSDVTFKTANPQASFSNLLNQEGYTINGATGSAYDYFKANSMGKLDITFDVVGPVTLSQPLSYYGKNGFGSNGDFNLDVMVRQACEKANENYNLDFSEYDLNNDGIIDNVFLIYAGYDEAQGAPSTAIWSQRRYFITAPWSLDGVSMMGYACTSELRGTSGSQIAGIGSFCHEFAHVLGIPDFYNTVSATSVMSNYFLMDNGNYNNNSQTPPYLSAIERYVCGWLDPVVLDDTPANMTLPSIGTNNAFRINTDTEGEFYLLETRSAQGWDTTRAISNLGYGLLIYHVDRSAKMIEKWGLVAGTRAFNSLNGVSSHYCCYIKKAGSVWAFQQLSSNRFSDETIPNALSWSGKSTKVPLSEIALNDKQVSFKVSGGLTDVPEVLSGSVACYLENSNIIIEKIQSECQISVYSLGGTLLHSSTTEEDLIIPFPKGMQTCIVQVADATSKHSFRLLRTK
ncbi:MAG: M6 family metalloprotease domain-containing protein [Bacteroidales bacterium]|nr:M6 family metalloprotease domain-containing protein [Bacteroidales bacterium]